MPPPYPNRALTEGFRNRLRTILHKLRILSLYGADVYIVVRHRGKYHEYSSSADLRWPPTRAEIAQSYPLPQRYATADFDPALHKTKQNIKGIGSGKNALVETEHQPLARDVGTEVGFLSTEMQMTGGS